MKKDVNDCAYIDLWNIAKEVKRVNATNADTALELFLDRIEFRSAVQTDKGDMEVQKYRDKILEGK